MYLMVGVLLNDCLLTLAFNGRTDAKLRVVVYKTRRRNEMSFGKRSINQSDFFCFLKI